MFANRRIPPQEALFYQKIQKMSDKFNPQDFGIPANQLTDVNMAMYNKAIKEL